MILNDYKIEGNKIMLSKKELEKWANHYLKFAKKHADDKLWYLYVGRHDSIVDILRLFDSDID